MLTKQLRQLTLLAVLLAVAAPAIGQDEPTAAVETAQQSAPETDSGDDTQQTGAASVPAQPDYDKGDVAWMLVSIALVLMMTCPGLALFYGGLVRKKNILSVMMQCVFLMGLMSVTWALIGYSLAFGGTNPYYGNFDHLLLNAWSVSKSSSHFRACSS
jgi:ammonium transporter, Amt family